MNINKYSIQSSIRLQRVLVHGSQKIKPIDRIVNANFTEDIHKELENLRYNLIIIFKTFFFSNFMD